MFLPSSIITIIVPPTVVFGYLLLVRSCRWRKYNEIHARYQAQVDGGNPLTPVDAQKIIQVSSFYDMPMHMNYALAFALFKTYAIPGISKILEMTGQLGKEENVAKRYAETEILITSWVACPMAGTWNLDALDDAKPDSLDPRGMLALARVNWIHSRFKIANDLHLYTLALFILEPPRWAKLYGWRSLSLLEQEAFFVFWSEIGRRMKIVDIPGTLHELVEWTKAYEEQHMVPAQSNHDISEHTLRELLFIVPNAFGLKSLGKRSAICLLEEKVRIAMMQPPQPRYLHIIMGAALSLVAFIHRYLCLPRLSPKSAIQHNMPIKFCPGREGKMHPTRYTSKPWYKPEPRNIVGRWMNRLLVLVGKYQDVAGPSYHSEGYSLHDMGPEKFRARGHDEVFQMAEEMFGHPIQRPWRPTGESVIKTM